MKPITAVLTSLLLAVGAAAQTASPPVSPAVRQLLLESLTHARPTAQAPATAVSAPEKFPTTFVFSGTTPGFKSIVGSLTNDAEQRRALVELLQQARIAFEQEAAKEGFANDVSAALAAFLVQHWSIARGGLEVDETRSSAFARQLRVALSTPGMKAAANAEKQALYEWLLGITFLTTASWEQGRTDPTKADLPALRAAADEAIYSLVGLHAADVEFGPTGVVLAPAKTIPSNGRSSPEPRVATTGPAPATRAGSSVAFTPGGLVNGRPSGLFWRFRVSLQKTMSVETLLFLPDGRLTASPKVDGDGQLDWAAVSAAGQAGFWDLQQGQLTVARNREIGPRTAPLTIEPGELRLKWLGETWKPAATNPAALQGRYHTESTSTTSSYGASATTTAYASIDGTFFFTADGRFSTTRSTAVSSQSNSVSDGRLNSASSGGNSTADEGRYQILGNALILRGRSDVRILPFIALNSEACLIGGSVYLISP